MLIPTSRLCVREGAGAISNAADLVISIANCWDSLEASLVKSDASWLARETATYPNRELSRSG